MRWLFTDKFSRNLGTRYRVQKVGQTYYIFDNDAGDFLIGMSFRREHEAYDIIKLLESKAEDE